MFSFSWAVVVVVGIFRPLGLHTTTHTYTETVAGQIQSLSGGFVRVKLESVEIRHKTY